MACKDYQIDEVLRNLDRKQDIQINSNTKEIKILKDYILDKKGDTIPNPEKKHDLGNKSWGKIDFLVNHQGFSIWYISTFKRQTN